MRKLLCLLPLLMVAACQNAGGGDATQVDGDYLATGGDGSNWAAIGYNYKEQRFSPLDKINASNVSELGIAWHADLPDARGQEATPVVVDGKMYISGAWSKVFAYDAVTGKELWSFDPKVPGEAAVNACCDIVNRGIAIWKGKIFVGTIDGRLIALDAITGAQLWSVQTTDKSKPYTITGAPRVVKNMVLIGNGGAEFGVRGYISAYDVNTGDKKWRFYTVPNPKGEADGEASDEILKVAAKEWSENGEWKISGGGGTVWDSIVYDSKLDQLYFGVGNGNPWNHQTRSEGKGDNWFLSSIVAVKPDTGEYIWHYQETPAETWDYTATQSIILSELEIGGEKREVIMHAPKNGFFFVIDRKTGKLIDANPFVDGINWASGYDKETGRPIENPEARFHKTGEVFLSNPGALGAHNWHPMSFNPTTGLAYIPAQQILQAYANEDGELDKRKSVGFNVGTSILAGLLPDDKAAYKAAVAATTGRLVAFDPVAGKVKWAVDYPTPWNGGTMTTAGNLVFQGTSMGAFKAYSADEGKELFSMDTQSGVIAAASTYSVGGEQYVAFLSSKGGAFPLVGGVAGGESRKIPSIPRLVVLKLGATGKLPDLPKQDAVAWNPPAKEGSAEDVAEGRKLYGRYCLVCHGDSAIGNGVTPDLRTSGTIASAEAWKAIVHGGALKDNGMVGFAAVMNEDQVDLVRKYVIERSHWTKENVADMSAPTAR